MKTRQLRIFLLIIASVVFIRSGFSQQTKVLKPIDREAVKRCKLAVESAPDSMALHKEYIKSIGWIGDLYWHAETYQSRYDSVTNELQYQYEKWMVQFPKSAIVPLALGSAYGEGESPKATEYLKRCLKLDPRLAVAYFNLSIDAERWGKREEAMEYMRMASVVAPGEPSYAFYYAMYFDEFDMEVFRQKIYDVVSKFPDHERGAQGLYWLASNTKDISSKIKVYEDLRIKYPPLKFSWSSSGMYGLFSSYILNKQYADAITLAESMISKQGWVDQLKFANGYFEVTKLIHAGKYKSAYDTLQAVRKIRSFIPGNGLDLIQAELADKTGDTRVAYESLVKLEAKSPSDEVLGAINFYASKIDRNQDSISADIWAVRKMSTKPATPFELELYTSDKKARLSDFQGKVVLLTFWFPGCGPCRAEFPYFENVVRKFSKDNLAYLGINVFPQQDDYVISFMKGTNYSFIPLRANSEWAAKAYNVRGEPTNFLIDKHGNIVYSNFRTGSENERSLELMIQSLIDKN